jgi:DNA-directed RNA polymerase specialized sigma subunit
MDLRIPPRGTPAPPPDPLYLKWRETQDPQTEQALLTQLRPTINKALEAFAGGDQTLATKAKILAKESLKTYDPSKRASLSTHVYGNLQRLNRIRQQRASALYVPESVRNVRQAIAQFKQQWRETHDKDPTEDDLTSHMGISRKQIRKSMVAGDTPEASMLSEKGDVWLTDSDPLLRARRIAMDDIYHDQDPDGKRLMELVMGYGGKPAISKSQAAAKLKISPAAVSQRLDGIMKKLEEAPTYARPDETEYDDYSAAE